ncbi:hypothetical protein WN944_023855 [Citrus x changshan-huyou]|uniref:Uncharacterized protein n=1 Tax=Citrus x changshan-huyou TaxID=2935761 RepID=A0AAP0LT53_9ROSI
MTSASEKTSFRIGSKPRTEVLSARIRLRRKENYGCRKSDQWIFGCFMGLRTGIRSSVEGGTDSAMEALE